MKCNTLTKGCSTYYKKLKTLIPVKGKYEKQFLNNIFENLEGICSEQPDITYKELCNRIGTPTDLLIEYFENADTAMRRIVIIALRMMEEICNF